MIANIVAKITSRIVIGIAVAISPDTGRRRRVSPKSRLPVKIPRTPRSQMKYLSGGGTSSLKNSSSSLI